jgi:methionine synthase II (cobalamin-independent)
VSVDLGVLVAGAYDELATALDEGAQVLLGVLPSSGSTSPATKPVVERVLRLLDMLGFDPQEVAGQLVLTPACGLAGASPSYARSALRAVHEASAEIG